MSDFPETLQEFQQLLSNETAFIRHLEWIVVVFSISRAFYFDGYQFTTGSYFDPPPNLAQPVT